MIFFILKALLVLNPIQDGRFLGCSWMGGAKRFPSLKSVTYLAMMEPGTLKAYQKKIQKLYESRDTPPELCWHQHFFTGNQQILLYQKIQILIVFWYIISNSFNFSWVFKHFCNKPGYNFGDASKSGYPRPS